MQGFHYAPRDQEIVSTTQFFNLGRQNNSYMLITCLFICIVFVYLPTCHWLDLFDAEIIKLCCECIRPTYNSSAITRQHTLCLLAKVFVQFCVQCDKKHESNMPISSITFSGTILDEIHGWDHKALRFITSLPQRVSCCQLILFGCCVNEWQFITQRHRSKASRNDCLSTALITAQSQSLSHGNMGPYAKTQRKVWNIEVLLSDRVLGEYILDNSIRHPNVYAIAYLHLEDVSVAFIQSSSIYSSFFTETDEHIPTLWPTSCLQRRASPRWAVSAAGSQSRSDD